MDVVDFEFPRDPSGRIHLVLKERSGIVISADSASGGTLRFLALLAALLGKHPAQTYFFEEIETGIHPTRLGLVLDFIERQTAKRGIQVVATTHSPDLLSAISETTFQNASIVFRPPHRDWATIRSISKMQNAARLRSKQGLGMLHATGWFEDILAAEASDEQDAAQ